MTFNADEWLELAHQALAAYQLSGATVAWLAYTHNAVFDVQHEQQRYVLRLTHQPEQKDRWRLSGEVIVLHITQNKGGLSVPTTIDAPGKQAYIFLPQAQVSGILYPHLPGITPTAAEITPAHTQRIGAFLAQLHTIPPIHWQTIRNNRVISLRPRLDYDGLFGDEGMYALIDATIFTESQQEIIAEVQEQVKVAMDVIGTDESDFGLIHGDLLLKNILFDSNIVRALDFEYSGFGYFMYDLAPLLWQLKPEPRYADLLDGLWEGYTALRPLPPYEHLETFIAARQVASLRWLANNQYNPAIAGKAPAMIAQRIEELGNFLGTGILQRQNI